MSQKPLQFVSVRERGTLSSCPSDGDSAEAAYKGGKSQGSCSFGCSSFLTATAVCSSGRTGRSSPVLFLQPHPEAGLLAPIPLASIAMKLPLMGERKLGVRMARQALLRQSLGPEENSPIPSYTKVLLP